MYASECDTDGEGMENLLEDENMTSPVAATSWLDQKH